MSKTATHTPGPWHLSIAANGASVSARTDSGATVALTKSDHPDTKGRKEANARLIAAAPEMLDELDVRVADLVMLRKAIEAGDPKAELLIRVDEMLRETRAVISKATS